MDHLQLDEEDFSTPKKINVHKMQQDQVEMHLQNSDNASYLNSEIRLRPKKVENSGGLHRKVSFRNNTLDIAASNCSNQRHGRYLQTTTCKTIADKKSKVVSQENAFKPLDNAWNLKAEKSTNPTSSLELNKDNVETLETNIINIFKQAVKELIETQEIYVTKLSYEIHKRLLPWRNYIKYIRDPSYQSFVATRVKLIFRNIDEVLEFHRNDVLPHLQTTEGDLISTVSVFNCLFEADRFQVHVKFNQGKKKADQICAEYSYECQSYIGVNHFLELPNRILFMYRNAFKHFISLYQNESKIINRHCDNLRLIRNVSQKLDELLVEVKKTGEQNCIGKMDMFPISYLDLQNTLLYEVKIGLFRMIDVQEQICETNVLRKKSQKKLQHLTKELVDVETKYVGKLVEWMIEFDKSNVFLKREPNSNLNSSSILRYMTLFHQKHLLPRLIACDTNMPKIIKLFNQCINDGCFYNYVPYNFTLKEEDLNGSVFVLPIQILPRYKMFFQRMIKALAGDLEQAKKLQQLISSCCVVENQLDLLLKTTNDARCLAEVKGIEEVNLHKQGDFLKMDEFDLVIGLRQYFKKYRARVFLFEKCFIIAVLISNPSSIRGTEVLEFKFLISRDDILAVTIPEETCIRLKLTYARMLRMSGKLKIVQTWLKLLSNNNE